MSDELEIKNYSQELANESGFSGVESDDECIDEEYENSEPFSPDSISISTKTIALDTVLRRLKNNTIKLAPDFQRSFVWDMTRKSRLIESMILRIPLPMFYVSEDENGTWEVVDGLQRLTTIQDFILGPDHDGKGDKLKNLEFWNDTLSGKDFFMLVRDIKATRIVNNILETELSFTIINPNTPEKVKRNIFKRINTGGMRLSEQEIRHALYQGKATNFLRDLALCPEYLFATGGTIKDDRMAGRELILRFLAFNIFGYENFKGDMDSFLSDAMLAINEEKPSIGYNIDIVQLAEIFKVGLIRASRLFSEHSFRKSLPGDLRKAPINKSLFECWINILSAIDDDDFSRLEKNINFFLHDYHELMNDISFSNSISRYGSSSTGSMERYAKILNLVSTHSKGY